MAQRIAEDNQSSSAILCAICGGEIRNESKNDSAAAVTISDSGRRAIPEHYGLAELPSTGRGRFHHPRFQIRQRRNAARVETALPHDWRVEARLFRRRAKRRAHTAWHRRLRRRLSFEPVRRRALRTRTITRRDEIFHHPA